MSKPYHLLKYNYTEGDNFTVIAHRGASAYYPENTIASFTGAIKLGAGMVELDVQLTADGEVVVFHDEKINRCTNGRGRVVEYSLPALKKFDAGSWFHKKFQGEKIPLLAEVLSVCKNEIAVNIEVKTEAVADHITGGIEEKCLQIVEKSGMRGHIVFSSFDPRALIHLQQIDSSLPTAVLFEKKCYGSHLPSDIINFLGAGAFNCSSKELNSKWLADLQFKNIPFNVYTINSEKKMKQLLAAGAGGIFTNCPDILIRVLEDFRQGQKEGTVSSENIQRHD
jgi:glycerophosphoryl diester phosphodiesterase